jgi:hypothetical protein
VTKCVSTNNTCGTERRARRYSAALSALNAFCTPGAPLRSTPGCNLIFPSGFRIARFQASDKDSSKSAESAANCVFILPQHFAGLRFIRGCNLTWPSGSWIARFQASDEDSSTSAERLRTACSYILNILLGLRSTPGCNLTWPSGSWIARFEASDKDSSTSAEGAAR